MQRLQRLCPTQVQGLASKTPFGLYGGKHRVKGMVGVTFSAPAEGETFTAGGTLKICFSSPTGGCPDGVPRLHTVIMQMIFIYIIYTGAGVPHQGGAAGDGHPPQVPRVQGHLARILRECYVDDSALGTCLCLSFFATALGAPHRGSLPDRMLCFTHNPHAFAAVPRRR